MKVIFSILLLCFQVNYQDHYQQILDDLTYNSVSLYRSMGKEAYFNFYHIDKVTHLKRERQYHDAVVQFYRAKTNIIDYLLRFENDTTTYSAWILTENPLSSTIKTNEILNNSKNALFLIDNYLSGRYPKILIPQYADTLTYAQIKYFLKVNRLKNKAELKRCYAYFQYVHFSHRINYPPKQKSK